MDPVLIPFDRISALAFEKASGVTLIEVDGVLERPAIVNVSGGGEGLAFARTFVKVGLHAEAVLVLEQTGSGTLADNVEVVVGDGASIESDRQYFFSHLCYAGVAFFVVLAGVWGDPSAGWARGKLLSSRVLGYLGTISLSLYLIHLAVMDQLGRWLGLVEGGAEWSLLQWAGWWVAVVAGSVALASIGFWLVERPCMNWRRRKPPPPGAPEEEKLDRVPGYAGAPA